MSTERKPFEIARSDGRSDAQVVIELVSGATPGTLFTFAQLQQELEKNTVKKYSRTRIGAAVRAAFTRLGEQHKRALRSVRGDGYLLAPAEDHPELAGQRETRAQRQLRRGLALLRHCRLDELTPNQRRLHEGHLLISAALYSVVQGVARRQQRTEEAIKNLYQNSEDLHRRVDQLEGKQG